MGNICASTRRLKEVFSSKTVWSKESGSTVRSVKERIESSKSHPDFWTTFLADPEPDLAEEADNREVFKALQLHPTWGSFFLTFGYNFGIWESVGTLEVGEKFAEGAQGELFRARARWGGSTMGRTEIEKRSIVEERIERSKCHWSKVVKINPKSKEEHVLEGSIVEEEVEGLSKEEEEAAKVSNMKEFKVLHENPSWGSFFYTFNEGELVVGEEPFAAGGQAEIYEAQIKWRHPNWRELFLRKGEGEDVLEDPNEYVLKVFKKGFLLEQLKSTLPQALLDFHRKRVGEAMKRRHNCDVVCGTLLEDGRFAFVLQREQADLRSLIERKMKMGPEQNGGPFSKEVTDNFMYEVARGMNWLHSHNIVHRDLKASNVLVREDEDWNCCFVADYECSVGTIGTGFHRAPEILRACKDRNASERPELFTRAADVYSYGMTCYEILTGNLPFQGHEDNEFHIVLEGPPLKVPWYVDVWMCDLLRRCWESNCAARPSFEEILNMFEKNSAAVQSYINMNKRMAHDKAYWSQPKTEALRDSELIRMFMAKKEKFRRLKSHLKKKEKSDRERKKELVTLVERRKQYLREDVLKSLNESEWTLKVLKKGISLRHLQVQWPQGLLKFHAERMEPPKTGTTSVWKKPRNAADILCGTLLEDGRFAFLIKEEQMDLRKLIDQNMKTSSGSGPFSKETAQTIMYDVAIGLDWLHTYGVVHRDMKASNVLVSKDEDGNYRCFVCDYECSIGILGTGLFRAPEILQAVADRRISQRPEIFSKPSDVYGYGMVCYEVLSGKIPFENHPVHKYDLVLNGTRPELPEHVDDWSRELLSRCWQSDPAARPSVCEILGMFRNFEGNSSMETCKRGPEVNRT